MSIYIDRCACAYQRFSPPSSQNGPSCVKPWDVIVKNNRKIGLLGFVPSEIFDIATPGNTVSLIQYTTAAQSAIAAMKTVHPIEDIAMMMSTSG